MTCLGSKPLRPSWRVPARYRLNVNSQKPEVVLAITVGIADQRHAEQRQAPHVPPFACPDHAPSVSPRLGLSIVECGWRLRAGWVFVSPHSICQVGGKRRGVTSRVTRFGFEPLVDDASASLAVVRPSRGEAIVHHVIAPMPSASIALQARTAEGGSSA